MPSEGLRKMLSRIKKEELNKSEQHSKEEVLDIENVQEVQATQDIQFEKMSEIQSPTVDGEPKKEEPVSSRPIINVSGDKMQATLRVTPAQNDGEKITVALIKSALQISKIIFGIDEEKISMVVENDICDENIVIANGKKSVNGENGHITPIVKISEGIMPQERVDGTVNYRELGLINAVTQEQQICKIELPTLGINGNNVYGDVLKAVDGKGATIPKGNNIGLSEDELFLVALCDGNLTYKDKKYNIDKVFIVKEDVDLSTGNIYFPGDVIIQGNVSEGFIVKADGSITVNGMVDAARLESGGSVLIKNGCLNANIIVKGEDLAVKFIENSTVYSNGNIKSDSIVNSEIFCEKIVDVSRKPGVIMGGEITSLGGVTAISIGSKSYIPTSIKIGDFAQELEEKHRLEKEIETVEDEISRYNQIIEFLNAKKKQNGKLDDEKEQLLGSSLRFRIQKLSEKKRLAKLINDIQEIQRSSKNSLIICKDVIYPGVRISINDVLLSTNQEIKFCRLYEKDGIVNIGVYA